MAEDVQYRAPVEACGILAGTEGTVKAVFPLKNELKSPVRFKMAPEEQLSTFNNIEDRGWELLAIYHSHPQGPATPSRTDIVEAYYPDAIYLIWSRRGDEWSCRGFRIIKGSYYEIPIQITH
jgi:proteasome lid subunit RPN8/RPN11